MSAQREVRDDLWTLILPPTMWAIHFVASHVLAAYACAPNVHVFRPISDVRIAIACFTALALIVIGLSGRRAWHEWRRHGGGVQHAEDTAVGRERLLEFSTLLLAALSFASVIFTAVPVAIMADCR